MPSLSRTASMVLVAAAVLTVTAPSALAAETSNSEIVIIPRDDVFPDDLYAGAVRVSVEGTLDGDLVAFAGEDIVIDGTVNGSVWAVAPRVVINGTVTGTVRAAANRLTITGSVEGDVVSAAVTASLSETSSIAGDVLLWSWSLESLGTIGQDLTGTQRTLDLAGTVEGDVEVSVNLLTVVGRLGVGGDLDYRSRNEIVGVDMAEVDGAVVAKTPLPPNLRIRALGLLGRLMIVLFLTVAALLAALGWPDRMRQAVGMVGHRPFNSWLKGALVLFSPLLIIGATGLILGLAPAAAAFPLLVVLVPLILACVGLVFALSLVAGAPTVGWLGGVLFRRLDMYGALVAGSIVVGVVWFLPWIGLIVPLVTLPLGLGALMGSRRDQIAESTAA